MIRGITYSEYMLIGMTLCSVVVGQWPGALMDNSWAPRGLRTFMD